MTSVLSLSAVSLHPSSRRHARSTLSAHVLFWIGLSACPLFTDGKALSADEAPTPSSAIESRPDFVADPDLFPEFLRKTTAVHFEDRPVGEALEYLSKLHGITIEIHQQSIKDHGLTLDTKINLKADRLTLEQVLKLVCYQSQIDWYVEQQVIHITPIYERKSSCRTFDLHELISLGHSCEILQKIAELGRTGSYEPEQSKLAWVGETMILNVGYHDARRICHAFDCLRRPPRTPTVVGDRTGWEKIESALLKPSEIDVEQQPLPEILRLFAEGYQIPICIDERGIREFGLSTDAPVSFFRKSAAVGKVLEDLLASLDLSFLIVEGVVFVTPTGNLDSCEILTVYNIQGLLRHDGIRSQIVPALVEATSGNWLLNDDDGGDLVLTDVDDLLFVRHNPSVQREIQKLLDQLRTNLEKHPDQKQLADRKVTKLTTVLYAMSKETAEELLTKIPKFVECDRWGEIDGETPMIDLLPVEPIQDQIEGEVTGATGEVRVIEVPPEQPLDPAASVAPAQKKVRSIVLRPRSALVIRQTRETHQQVRKFLRTLGTEYEILTDYGTSNGMVGECFF